MANPDAPFGLKPVRHATGAPYTGAANLYYVGTGNDTALFIGDPVVMTGTSNTAAFLGHEAGTLPSVTKATAGDGNRLVGVIVGFTSSDRDDTVYRTASTERGVLVADDPDLLFHIRDDGVAALAATSVGLNAVLIFTHSGNTVYGISGAELDTNSDAPAADASNQLHIMRLAPIPGNILGARAIWEVRINNHQLRGDVSIGV